MGTALVIPRKHDIHHRQSGNPPWRKIIFFSSINIVVIAIQGDYTVMDSLGSVGQGESSGLRG